MILADKELLVRCRLPGRCELCKKWCKIREPSHVYSVGAGRVDHPWNICVVGSTLNFECPCHTKSHNKPMRRKLEEAVANREGIPINWIEEMVYLVRRLPKETSLDELDRILSVTFLPF